MKRLVKLLEEELGLKAWANDCGEEAVEAAKNSVPLGLKLGKRKKTLRLLEKPIAEARKSP